MGMEAAQRESTLRFSFSEENTFEEVDLLPGGIRTGTSHVKKIFQTLRGGNEMIFHAFLIKYAEIAIKGKNRYLFEDALVKQMNIALSKM